MNVDLEFVKGVRTGAASGGGLALVRPGLVVLKAVIALHYFVLND